MIAQGSLAGAAGYRDNALMDAARRIEREFGVPVPGEIQDPALWTKTALKRLPTTGTLDWKELFGREAPVAAWDRWR